MKRFDLTDSLRLSGIERRTWTKRWDMVVPGAWTDQVVLYSRHEKLLKVVDLSDNSSRVAYSESNFGERMSADYVQVIRGNFGQADLGFYDRVQGRVDFYRMTSMGRVLFLFSSRVGSNVEAMAAGYWTNPFAEDLVLYDKFAGELRVMTVRTGANQALGLQEVARHDFDMNVEQLVAGDFDGDFYTDVLAYNQDSGTGKFIEFNRRGAMSVLFERDDLPVSEGVTIVPGHFSSSKADSPKTDLLFYSRDCGADAVMEWDYYHNTYSDVHYRNSNDDELVAGVCQDVSNTPGCAEDRDVQECVCTASPECCSGAWDASCADQVVELGCYAAAECEGVGQLLTDVAKPASRWGWSYGFYNSYSIKSAEPYEWSKRFRWGPRWTHIIAPDLDRRDSSSELLFYSNTEVVDVTMVLLSDDNAGFHRKDESAIARTMRENVQQLKRSFLPAGLDFEWDGEFVYLENSEMNADPCSDDTTDTQREQTGFWADVMGNSTCRECILDADVACEDGDRGACEDAAQGECSDSCPLFEEEGTVAIDSMVIFLKSKSLKSCSGHESRAVRYGIRDSGVTSRSFYRRSDGDYNDRFGNHVPDWDMEEIEALNRGTVKETNLKLLVHEVGHYFGLGHTHSRRLTDDLADEDAIAGILDRGGVDGLREDLDDEGVGYHGIDTRHRWAHNVYDVSHTPVQDGRSLPMSIEEAAGHVDDRGRVLCADEPLEFTDDTGRTVRINPERSQIMTYGAHCDGLFRFSTEQIQGIRHSVFHDYETRRSLKGKSFLFR